MNVKNSYPGTGFVLFGAAIDSKHANSKDERWWEIAAVPNLGYANGKLLKNVASDVQIFTTERILACKSFACVSWDFYVDGELIFDTGNSAQFCKSFLHRVLHCLWRVQSLLISLAHLSLELYVSCLCVRRLLICCEKNFAQALNIESCY